MGWKLSPHAFTRFWDLHAWSGVTAGLVVYVMFLTGGLTLFHEQLETWEEPLAQHSAQVPAGLQHTLDRALAANGEPIDDLWLYPPKDGHGAARIAFQDAGTWKTAWVDSTNDKLIFERERLAHFLYSLHFLWHDLTGNWLYTLAGVLAVALSLALVTGLLIHIKAVVRQFFQFRPEKPQRVWWSDMHKVLGVMGFPFQLMYAYTGASIVLMPLLLTTFVGPVFGGDEQRAASMAWGPAAAGGTPAGAGVQVLPLDELVERAARLRPDLSPEYLHVVHNGRDNGSVEVWGQDAGSPRARVFVRVMQTDGSLDPLSDLGATGAAASARRWLHGLHFAAFGGLSLRLLFFGLALAGGLTIISGNWVWISRRPRSRGNELLARLTVGIGAGTWVALGALFLASRMLPFDWRSRGAAEELTFVGVLASCIIWALLAADRNTLWWQQLAVAACCWLPVPVLACRWSQAGLFGSGPHLATVVAVDVGLLLAAVGTGASAWVLSRAEVRVQASQAATVSAARAVGPSAISDAVSAGELDA